jgi:uncharacterized protein with PIN domain
MGRIQNAYEMKFRTWLRIVRARRVEQGVRWLVADATRLSQQERIPVAQALADTCERLGRKIERWQNSVSARSPELQGVSKACSIPPVFVCDAGLGGLARWLRAAGFETYWRQDITDDELLHEARRLSAILLTTDSILMERRILQKGIIPALWVPPVITMVEQLKLVMHELRLSPREPRCMSCGGVLLLADKEAVRDRIPPKTYLWLDRYFVCAKCGKLFWHGTHWEKIQRRLETLN